MHGILSASFPGIPTFRRRRSRPCTTACFLTFRWARDESGSAIWTCWNRWTSTPPRACSRATSSPQPRNRSNAMRIDQWQKFKAAAKRQPMAEAPLALIVDSPWMPGYLGIGHLDYYNDPEVWFQANLKLAREFPEVILFPSWWVEYGMGIEPSAFGTRLHFFPDQTPGQTAVLFRAEDIDRFSPINPLADGLMPLALHRYRTQKQRIFDAGFTIPVVTARGPLCTAGFVRGVND